MHLFFFFFLPKVFGYMFFFFFVKDFCFGNVSLFLLLFYSFDWRFGLLFSLFFFFFFLFSSYVVHSRHIAAYRIYE
jgi:hypothetical protein